MEYDYIKKVCEIAYDFLASNVRYADRDFQLYLIRLVNAKGDWRVTPDDEPFWEITFEERFKDGHVRDPGGKIVRISDRTGKIMLAPTL
ncbi:MAG: hypothetical protein IT447_16980 [Phycisphaerales bacterium]|nr:hypothetical protein [Phycisphaerales bacterium]